MPKPKGEPRVRWNISIPTRLAEEFDALHFNPTLERSSYGARSEFVEGAITDFLRKHKRQDGVKVLEKFKTEDTNDATPS
ncbi:hypothetical protein [Microcystis phage Mel-JY34]